MRSCNAQGFDAATATFEHRQVGGRRQSHVRPTLRLHGLFARLFAAVAVALALAPAASSWAQAPIAGGIQMRSGTEWLWPQVQARISMSTGSLSPLNLARGAVDLRRSQPLALQGAAVMGDYVFMRPALGQFRTTSGLLLGSQGAGASQLAALGGLQGLRSDAPAIEGTWQAGQAVTGTDGPIAQPYVGFGYRTPQSWSQFSLMADLGWTAQRPGAATALGRAWLGSQPWDAAFRDMRWTPLVQLGMRYSF